MTSLFSQGTRQIGKFLWLSPNNQCPISRSHCYSQYWCLASFLLVFQQTLLLQSSKLLHQFLFEEMFFSFPPNYTSGEVLTSVITTVFLLSFCPHSKAVSFCMSRTEFEEAPVHIQSFPLLFSCSFLFCLFFPVHHGVVGCPEKWLGKGD